MIMLKMDLKLSIFGVTLFSTYHHIPPHTTTYHHIPPHTTTYHHIPNHIPPNTTTYLTKYNFEDYSRSLASLILSSKANETPHTKKEMKSLIQSYF